jgi:hypothetical protein
MEGVRIMNGSPMREGVAEEGTPSSDYRLSSQVNKAIAGFWARRGLPEPGCDRNLNTSFGSLYAKPKAKTE